jgi:hypothetical protein
VATLVVMMVAGFLVLRPVGDDGGTTETTAAA